MRVALITTDRQCGGCTACCTALTVVVLDKPEYVACRHQGLHECTIYNERPATCRDYRCLWHQGYMDESFRPDCWGLILDMMPTVAGPRLRVWETEVGVWDRPGIAWQVRKIAERLKLPGIVLWRFGVRGTSVGAPMQIGPSATDTPWLELAVPV